jgi:hypothetical protein
MTPDEFRHVVLSMPNAVQSSHLGHPDFRVGNKVFATLGSPGDNWRMVKLTPKQQDMIVAAEPGIKPANGAWGRRCSTLVFLQRLDHPLARRRHPARQRTGSARHAPHGYWALQRRTLLLSLATQSDAARRSAG